MIASDSAPKLLVQRSTFCPPEGKLDDGCFLLPGAWTRASARHAHVWVVAVDGSELSMRSLRLACFLLNPKHADKIIVANIVKPGTAENAGLFANCKEEARKCGVIPERALECKTITTPDGWEVGDALVYFTNHIGLQGFAGTHLVLGAQGMNHCDDTGETRMSASRRILILTACLGRLCSAAAAPLLRHCCAAAAPLLRVFSHPVTKHCSRLARAVSLGHIATQCLAKVKVPVTLAMKNGWAPGPDAERAPNGRPLRHGRDKSTGLNIVCCIDGTKIGDVAFDVVCCKVLSHATGRTGGAACSSVASIAAILLLSRLRPFGPLCCDPRG